MTHKLIVYNSPAALRHEADRWDDLWRRSDVTVPVAQADLIAHWAEHWAPRRRFRALAVAQDGQLVAALPVVSGRVRGVAPAGRQLTNHCSWAGDLLLDPRADDEALHVLLAGLRAQWSLLWIDTAPIGSERWQRFCQAAHAMKMPGAIRSSFRIGQIEIDHDWETYQAQWSSNHRRQIRRSESRAEREGGARLVTHRDFWPEQIEALVRRGFTVEHRSWKGRAGTSILQDDKALAYYTRQASLLAEREQLQLTFLELGDQPIAFEYGWQSKGVYFSPKVGYDDVHAALSPGQLLRARLYRELFSDHRQRQVDFAGPLSEATGKWATAGYTIGRVVIGLRPVGGLFVHAYRRLWPKVRGISLSRRHRDAVANDEFLITND